MKDVLQVLDLSNNILYMVVAGSVSQKGADNNELQEQDRDEGHSKEHL